MRMNEPRKIFSPFAAAFSLRSMIGRSKQNLVFPFYHSVSDAVPPHLKYLYPVRTTAEFRNDMDFLLKNFDPLDPGILLSEKEKVKINKPSFILSFDDGLREVKEIILPILKEKGITAIFFLNNDFIGNKDLFFRYKASLICDTISKGQISASGLRNIAGIVESKSDSQKEIISKLLDIRYSNKEMLEQSGSVSGIDFHMWMNSYKPYLEEEDIRLLIKEGFYIGSHSLDHPYFSEIDIEEQKKQVLLSINGIQEKFKLNYRFFAFPFTDHGLTPELWNTIERSSDAAFGTAGIKKQLRQNYYQRIPMEKTGSGAENVIKTEYFYFLIKSLFGR